MIAVILALVVSLCVSLFASPLVIKFFINRQMGQFIRSDGPQTHLVKRGTPTMGGVIIILATAIGFTAASIFNFASRGTVPGAAPIILIVIMALTGSLGFIDDYLKISKAQNEGLSIPKKLILQALVAIIIAGLMWAIHDENGVSIGNTSVSFFGLFSFEFLALNSFLGFFLFMIWVNFIITAWTNAVNFTDGLDGLCSGASLFTFGGYILICIWEASQSCFDTGKSLEGACYSVSHPFELGIVCAAIFGACIGFLWWNTSPAKIYMGDTGSLALGGAFAGISMMTHTEFLAILIGGLYFVEMMSDVIQIGVFKTTHKRVFKMAPIHHHFELKGWQEITIVVRFWLIAAFFTTLGLVAFYLAWVLSAQIL